MIHRTTFEHKVVLYGLRAFLAGEGISGPGVARHDIFPAPAIEPETVRGALAEALGNRDVARRYYMTALGLDPQNAVYRSKAFGQEAQ
jgi:hypothetical protein